MCNWLFHVMGTLSSYMIINWLMDSMALVAKMTFLIS